MFTSPLHEQAHFIDKVANWWHEEWGYLSPDKSLADRIQEVQLLAIKREDIPKAHIAISDDKLLGTATLVKNDLPSIPHNHTPWLASVFVDPKMRRQGIGRKLVQTIEESAKNLGYKNIYLFTPDQEAWYASFGWTLLEYNRCNDHGIAIMQKSLG